MEIKRKLSLLLTGLMLVLKGSSQQLPDIEDDFLKEPALNWRFPTNGPIYASPVIEDNMVYIGSSDSIFYAIDIKTGGAKWKIKTGSEIRSTALIANGLIYFISGDGKLYCVNHLGKIVWTFTRAEKKYDFADYHQSTPAIYNNTLFFGMGDGIMYAVNPLSGKVKWEFKTEGVVHSAPVFENNKMFFGSFDGNIYAVKIDSGILIWKFKTVGHRYFPKGEVQGSPAITKTCVIFGARDYNVYAIDKENGYCHWNKVYDRGWVLINSIKDSLLFMAGADERILACVDPETGTELWKKKMEFLMFGKPAYTKSMLYIGTTMGKLHGINSKTGEMVWTVTTDNYQRNRLKYLKEDDTYRDDIYSIIKSNEQFLDAEVDLGGIFSSPVISDNKIIFTSTDGYLYCLKRSN